MLHDNKTKRPANKTILVIMNAITAACDALKEAGAREVRVLTLSRANLQTG
jgi:hypothetical protein